MIIFLVAFVFAISSILFTSIDCSTASAESDFTYTVLSDNTIEITEYKGSDIDIVIPSTIDGYTVSSIGYSAMGQNKTVKSIYISDGITNIGNFAFTGCSSLETIRLPEGITELGMAVFSNCESVKSLSFPPSLTTIGTMTFNGCNSLETVIIPPTITSIGKAAFNYCKSLKRVVLPNTNINIADNAFYNNRQLESVLILENVTTIAANAFQSCPNLTIYGFGGSPAQTYADENSIAFFDLSTILIGDIDLDGQLTINDYSLACSVSVTTYLPNQAQIFAGDVNEDYTVDGFDAILIEFLL